MHHYRDLLLHDKQMLKKFQDNFHENVHSNIHERSYRDKRSRQQMLQKDQVNQVLLSRVSTRVDQLSHLIDRDHY